WGRRERVQETHASILPDRTRTSAPAGTQCRSPFALQLITATGPRELELRCLQELLCDPWSLDRDLVPPQRRVPACAARGGTPVAHNSPRCSAARSRFCSRDRSAW